MRRTILPPLIVLVLALVALAAAILLDRGDASSRDTALLVGTIALWGVAAAVLWLLGVLGYLAYRHRRSTRR